MRSGGWAERGEGGRERSLHVLGGSPATQSPLVTPQREEGPPGPPGTARLSQKLPLLVAFRGRPVGFTEVSESSLPCLCFRVCLRVASCLRPCVSVNVCVCVCERLYCECLSDRVVRAHARPRARPDSEATVVAD